MVHPQILAKYIYNHVIELMYLCMWLCHRWLMKVVSGCTVLFGSRIINCSQEETLGNLLSRRTSQRVGFAM